MTVFKRGRASSPVVDRGGRQARVDTPHPTTPQRKRTFSAMDGPADDDDATGQDPEALPTDVQDGGAPATKRQRVDLTAPLATSDLVRVDLEANPNQAALKQVYETYYDGGGVRRKTGAELEEDLKILYRIMTEGGPDYVREPVSEKDLVRFLKTPNVRITAQEMGRDAQAKYTRRKREWDQQVAKLPPGTKPPREPRPLPRNRHEAVARGDYFHVHNESGKLRYREPSRRIVVNVGSQQAALKVAESLTGLFKDNLVSPHLSEYKIFLSQAASTPETRIKHDKLVVYYTPADDSPDAVDTVGDKIADTITSAITPGDVGGAFAPFYSRISDNLAWGEETEHFVHSLKGSFTQAREQIIKKLIQSTDEVGDLNAFTKLVAKAFQSNWIDPDQPHRHLSP
jgi:hypothetical protein